MLRQNLKMRKILLTLLALSLLAVLTSSTIIITHSTPKFFQLSQHKMAIVIDQDEGQALSALARVQSQQSDQTAHATPAMQQETANTDSNSQNGQEDIFNIFRSPQQNQLTQTDKTVQEKAGQSDILANAQTSVKNMPTDQAETANQSPEQTKIVENVSKPASLTENTPSPSIQQKSNDEELALPTSDSPDSFAGEKVGSAQPSVDSSVPFVLGLPNPNTPSLLSSSSKPQDIEANKIENPAATASNSDIVSVPLLGLAKPQASQAVQTSSQLTASSPQNLVKQPVVASSPLQQTQTPEPSASQTVTKLTSRKSLQVVKSTKMSSTVKHSSLTSATSPKDSLIAVSLTSNDPKKSLANLLFDDQKAESSDLTATDSV